MSSEIVVALIGVLGVLLNTYLGIRTRRDIRTQDDEPPIGPLTTEIRGDVQSLGDEMRSDVKSLRDQQRRTFVAVLRHILIDHADSNGDGDQVKELLDNLAKAEEETE